MLRLKTWCLGILTADLVVVVAFHAFSDISTQGVKAPAYAVLAGSVLVTWIVPVKEIVPGKEQLLHLFLSVVAAVATLLAGWHWWFGFSDAQPIILWGCVLTAGLVALVMIFSWLWSSSFGQRQGNNDLGGGDKWQT